MRVLRGAYKGFIVFLEILCDLFGIGATFILAHFTYTRTGNVGPDLVDKLPLMGFAAAMILAIFYFNDLYRKNKSILNIEETRLVLKCLIVAALVTFALFELTRGVRNPDLEGLHPWILEIHDAIARQQIGDMFPRLEITLAFAYMFPILSLMRYGIFKLQQNLHLKGFGNERVLIWGQGDLARRLRDKIQQSPKSGYYLVGRIGNGDAPLEGVRELGGPNDLKAVVTQYDINRLIVADSHISPEQMVAVLHEALSLGIDLEFVPALHSLFVHRIQLSDVDGLPLLSVKNLNGSLWQRACKRLFDLCMGGLLTLVSLPLMAVIALWIRLDNPGPVFFRQQRIGRDGKPFTMLKFRSMRTDAAAYAPTPEAHEDPRITKVGRWIRRFSLDELPQFFNVIAGSMSLVGPRPEMPFITEDYGAQERERLRVKPGITGLWQISADRRRQIHENLDYDLYYIEHQSILLDLVILMRTFYSVIAGKGAW